MPHRLFAYIHGIEKQDVNLISNLITNNIFI